jgi:ankyrin repeat protein
VLAAAGGTRRPSCRPELLLRALIRDGKTPLAIACELGHDAAVKAIVEADPTIVAVTSRDGFAPVHFASIGGHVRILRLLLGMGASPSPRARFGQTPLHFACLHGHVEAAALLISAGADVHAVCKMLDTPLACAVRAQSEPLCLFLLGFGALPGHLRTGPALGAAPDSAARFGSRSAALNAAAGTGNIKLCRLLLQRMREYGCYPPDASVFFEGVHHVPILRVLIEEERLPFDSPVAGSSTPLYLSTAANALASMRYLLRAGAQADGPVVTSASMGRVIPLCAATTEQAARVLVEIGGANPALVHVFTYMGRQHVQSPYVKAAELDRLSVLRYFCRHDDTGFVDPHTPLMRQRAPIAGGAVQPGADAMLHDPLAGLPAETVSQRACIAAARNRRCGSIRLMLSMAPWGRSAEGLAAGLTQLFRAASISARAAGARAHLGFDADGAGGGGGARGVQGGLAGGAAEAVVRAPNPPGDLPPGPLRENPILTRSAPGLSLAATQSVVLCAPATPGKEVSGQTVAEVVCAGMRAAAWRARRHLMLAWHERHETADARVARLAAREDRRAAASVAAFSGGSAAGSDSSPPYDDGNAFSPAFVMRPTPRRAALGIRSGAHVVASSSAGSTMTVSTSGGDSTANSDDFSSPVPDPTSAEGRVHAQRP